MMVCVKHAAQIVPPAPNGACDVCYAMYEIAQQAARFERERIGTYLRGCWREPEIAAAIEARKHWAVTASVREGAPCSKCGTRLAAIEPTGISLRCPTCGAVLREVICLDSTRIDYTAVDFACSPAVLNLRVATAALRQALSSFRRPCSMRSRMSSPIRKSFEALGCFSAPRSIAQLRASMASRTSS
jgi:hypothetical protein